MKKVLAAIALLCGLLLADETERVKISVGGLIVTEFESELQISKKDLPLGVLVNTKDQLGMQYDTAALRLDGYYRLNEKHAIELSYYAVKSYGENTAAANFELGDTLFQVGSKLQSRFDLSIYRLGYLYSFYRNPDIELQLSAGVHLSDISFRLQATRFVKLNDYALVNPQGILEIPATVPLPVIGIKGKYTLDQRRWYILYSSELFALKLDGFKGSYLNTQLGTEYRFSDDLAAGISYDMNDASVVQTFEEGKKLKIRNTLNGLLVNLSYYY